jgi:hypothetical protein
VSLRIFSANLLAGYLWAKNANTFLSLNDENDIDILDEKSAENIDFQHFLAPRIGFEPTAFRLGVKQCHFPLSKIQSNKFKKAGNIKGFLTKPGEFE